MTSIRPPYLLFLGDARTIADAKTAAGVAYWRPTLCAGQLRLARCEITLGLPEMSVAEAASKGVRTLIVGLAPLGGTFAPAWTSVIREALRLGLDVASGLHTRLGAQSDLAALAAQSGSQIFDVRSPSRDFPAAVYRKRSGRRLLTVGTDCAVGKKFTALAIEREMHARGEAATFRATGQTGILIAGDGVAVDAVVADFLAGAAEWLSPDADPDHWDLIEGQGSLFHPSYAGVSLGLLHGSQPDALVICHDCSRTANSDFADLPLPSLEECAELNLRHARLVNPEVRLAGAALNTSTLPETEARQLLEQTAYALGAPACDPIRFGVRSLVDVLIGVRQSDALRLAKATAH